MVWWRGAEDGGSEGREGSVSAGGKCECMISPNSRRLENLNVLAILAVKARARANCLWRAQAMYDATLPSISGRRLG